VLRKDRGSAPLQSIFSITVLMLLAMGVVEVALFLYGRNMLAASAHEGARAAIELGTDLEDASAIATTTIEKSTGRLLEDVEVAVSLEDLGERSIVVVEVTGRINAPGPIPFGPSVSARASATKEAEVR
jgi:TadE-like protein